MTGDSLSLSSWVIATLGSFVGPIVSSDPYYTSKFITTYKASEGGTDCADTTAQFALALHGNDPNFTNRVASIGCGHNDVIHGYSAAQSYDAILATVAEAQAEGYSVVVETVTDTVNTDIGIGGAFRSDLNALIVGGAGTYGYAVSDVGADADLGCTGCYTNLTYFDPDGVHLTPDGITIKAGYMATQLAALGLN